MLAERELSVDLLRGGVSFRRLLGYGLFVLVALGVSGMAQIGGSLTLILLLVVLAVGALVAATYIVMILTITYVDVGLAMVHCTVPLGAMVGVIGSASRLAPQDPLSAAPATEAAVGQRRGGR